MSRTKTARSRRSLPAILAALLMLLGIPAVTTVVTATPAMAAGEQAVVKMPFNGKWASSASHPSTHGPLTGGTKWAMDVYALNADVRTNVVGINGSLSHDGHRR